MGKENKTKFIHKKERRHSCLLQGGKGNTMEDRVFDRCMERIRQGDKEALKEIYIAYAGFLFHFILGILGNRENAEDVTSEFFIKLWDIADKYVPGTGHKAWLSRIARNMAIDYLRKHKREIPYDAGERKFEMLAASDEGAAESGTNCGGYGNESDNRDSTAEEAVSNLTIKEALDRLKPAEREIVHLKIIGDMTFEEISGLLETPMGTVTWRYREAIKKLRRCGYEA